MSTYVDFGKLAGGRELKRVKLNPARTSRQGNHDGRSHAVRIIALGVLFLCGLLASGCTKPPSEAVVRQQSVESLWNTLQSNYVYFEVRQNIRMYRDFALKQVKQAKTRREYVVALAQALGTLSDAHISFTNLTEWWKNTEGTDLIDPFLVIPAGSYVWIAFDRNAVVIDERETLPPPQAFYQLLRVEAVPASELAVHLLKAESDYVVPVTVVALDGKEYSFGLKVMAPVSPVPSSQPATQPAGASTSQPESLAALTFAPFFGPFTTYSKGGVASMRVGSTGYIALRHLRTKEVVDDFDAALDSMMDTRALVLDLRWNAGGNSGVTSAILSRFVSEIRPYGLVQERAKGRVTGVDMPIWYSVLMFVGSRGTTYHKPVVVLTDTTTASMGEVLAFALQDTCSAVLVGSRTMGAGAGLAYTELPDGLAIQYSAFPLRRLDGRGYQYIGVPPDYVVEVDRAAVCTKGIEGLVAYYTETFKKGLEIAESRASKWGGTPQPSAATKPAAKKGRKSVRQ